MSTRSSQTANGTSTILDCLLVNGVPIITWINTQITNLQTQINLIETDITLIKGQIAALQAALTALQACCASIQQYIANNHKALTLTKTQDVANRTTLDVANQVLNIPPAIACRAITTSITVVPTQTLTPLAGLDLGYETVPGMVTGGQIVIPRAGRYNLVGSWSTNTDEPNAIDGYAIQGGFLLNGTNFAGRFTAPLITGRADQLSFSLPGQLFSAGDTVSLFGYTDLPAGLTVTGEYLAVEYIEGT